MRPDRSFIVGVCALLATVVAGAAAKPDYPATQAADTTALLLTGQVTSATAQSILVPKAGEMWHYQIQWMLPEGTVAEPGQTVVVFNKEAIASRIEQLEANLLRVTAQEQSQSSELDAELLQAEFELKQAELTLEKAELDAGIPAKVIAAKEYAEYQFELLKAGAEVAKKRRALEEAGGKRSATLTKLAIDKQQAQLELTQALTGLEQLEIEAELSGPMIYARHPWEKKKFAVGDSVQAGRKVAMIPARDALEVIAWVNEVDVDRIALNAPVRLSLDAVAKVKLEGAIQLIGSQADSRTAWGNSTWFPVEIRVIGDAEVELTPGMSVLVEVMEQAS